MSIDHGVRCCGDSPAPPPHLVTAAGLCCMWVSCVSCMTHSRLGLYCTVLFLMCVCVCKTAEWDACSAARGTRGPVCCCVCWLISKSQRAVGTTKSPPSSLPLSLCWLTFIINEATAHSMWCVCVVCVCILMWLKEKVMQVCVSLWSVCKVCAACMYVCMHQVNTSE